MKYVCLKYDLIRFCLQFHRIKCICLIFFVVISVHVLINGITGELEMIVINVLGDPIEEVRISEHVGHVDDVIHGDVPRAAVVLQYLVG